MIVRKMLQLLDMMQHICSEGDTFLQYSEVQSRRSILLHSFTTFYFMTTLDLTQALITQ